VASFDEEFANQRQLEEEKLNYQNQVIEELTAQLKSKDREFERLKAFKDKETSRERLRHHRFIDKGRDIMTIIQDDELSSKMLTN
jgi:hypothetical protein